MANADVMDKIGMIIPFGLYDKCIQKNARCLMSVSKCKGVSETYNIMEVSKLFSNEHALSTEVLSEVNYNVGFLALFLQIFVLLYVNLALAYWELEIVVSAECFFSENGKHNGISRTVSDLILS